MKKIVAILLGITVLCALCSTSFAGDKEDFVQSYPGGDYGINIGGGYESMPDGKLLAPEAYREDYQDSPYGPITKKGFLLFPSFEFSDSKKANEEKEKRERQLEEKQYIFDRAFQQEEDDETEKGGEKAVVNPFWGFSSPKKERTDPVSEQSPDTEIQ